MSYSIKEVIKQRVVPFVLLDLTIGQINPFKLHLTKQRTAGVYNARLKSYNQKNISWGAEFAPKCYLANSWWLVNTYVGPEDGLVLENYYPELIRHFIDNPTKFPKISSECAIFSKVASFSELESAMSTGNDLPLAGLIIDTDKIRMPFALESRNIRSEFEDELVLKIKDFAKTSEVPLAVTGKQFTDELDEISATGPLYWMTQGDLMSRGISAICAEQDSC